MTFEQLLAAAKAAFERLTPQEQREHRQRQRESFTRGQTALAECERDRRNIK